MDHKVTQLLGEWRAGNRAALDELMPLVYDQLRSLAGRYMRSERPDHTLRATAVVHEAYLRLAGADVSFENRVHFYAIAARMMRRILLDWAKGSRRQKRGDGAIRVEMNEQTASIDSADPETVIEIDRGLERLASFDPKKAELLEMIFFGGLTYDEAAAEMEITPAKAYQDARLARAWLYKELTANRKSQS